MNDRSHPLLITQELCQRHKVDPILLVATLLKSLSTFHLFNSGFYGSKPGGDATRDIENLCSMTGRKEIPASLLAALDMALELQQFMDAKNAEVYQSKNTPHSKVLGDTLAHEAKAAKVLRLIIKEVMNQAEHQGLQGRLNMEQRAKDDPDFGHLFGDNSPPPERPEH